MLTVLLPENGHSGALRALLTPLLPAGSTFRDPDDGLEGLAGRRLLFAVALDEGGCNESYYRMLSRLRRSLTLLHGCVAGLVVTGVGEFYTKDVARAEAAAHADGAGPVHGAGQALAAGGGDAVRTAHRHVCLPCRPAEKLPFRVLHGVRPARQGAHQRRL